MSVPPRRHLMGLSRSFHGGITPGELERLGLDAGQVVDFSVNTNPFGPAPGVLEAVRRADFSRYPDPEAWELRAVLAEALKAPADQILAGNGSVELIWLIALSYLGPGDRALILPPTFGEYAAAAKIAGAEDLRLWTSRGRGFVPDLDALAQVISVEKPKVVFVCNPNNPTGVVVPAPHLRGLAETHPDTLFVIDEAYLSFLEEGPSCLE